MIIFTDVRSVLLAHNFRVWLGFQDEQESTDNSKPPVPSRKAI